jgi:hypothetical protein
MLVVETIAKIRRAFFVQKKRLKPNFRTEFENMLLYQRVIERELV